MHGSSLCRMKWFVDNFLKDHNGSKVLDVGSYDVAGGTYKPFFPADKFAYSGLDMVPGPNVDIVPENPYLWRELANDSFDVVISGQAFEHMEFFWVTAGEMARVLKPGGLMCIIAPRGFERHRYPLDCYRFDADGMAALAKWCNLDLLHASTDMQPADASDGWHIERCEDSFLIAQKPLIWPGLLDVRKYQYVESGPLPESGFSACPAFAEPPAIPLAEHEEIIERHKCALEERAAEIERLTQLLKGYEVSNSWRITRPLRALRSILRKFGRGA